MATLKDAVFPINNFIGTQVIPVFAIPDDSVGISLNLDGSTMLDPACKIVLTLDFSPDGVTWSTTSPGPTTNPFPVVAEITCGAKNRQGNPLPVYNVSAMFPAGTGRSIRGSVVVTGAPLTTIATLDVI